MSYASVQQSELLRCMTNGRHFHMQVYWRGKDQKLFDYFTSLYDKADSDIRR